MATASEITSEGEADFRAAARRRHQVDLQVLAAREERAWDLARQAAVLLRAEFHADQVVVFGSLIHAGCFTPWSDVDVAASGIESRETLRAMEAVRDLSDEIPVHLVDLAACSDSLRTVIEQEGRSV
jgi:predicted nucleotidyltransferase